MKQKQQSGKPDATSAQNEPSKNLSKDSSNTSPSKHRVKRRKKENPANSNKTKVLRPMIFYKSREHELCLGHKGVVEGKKVHSLDVQINLSDESLKDKTPEELRQLIIRIAKDTMAYANGTLPSKKERIAADPAPRTDQSEVDDITTSTSPDTCESSKAETVVS